MVIRTFWQRMIERALEERSVVWLAGVRRSGKTVLCQNLPHVEYFDCELPSTRRMMEDPEAFLRGVRGKRIVLDEIHRLPNPSELLKIAADHMPDVKVIATGSSTLGASRMFRDTLTGRKRTVWLTPLLLEEVQLFGGDIDHRLFYGGLPPFFLSKRLPDRDVQEWMDDYWAKDIQVLFRLERRASFQRFFELLFMQSGGIFQASKFTKRCEVSHVTIRNYLQVLEDTFVAHVVRPFSSHAPTEIVSAPKVYGFDTGFACAERGWKELRQEDRGALFEHLVLNELHARSQARDIRYWRDKQGHEIDFVIPGRGNTPPIAIECSWESDDIDERTVRAFARHYPRARLFLVANDVQRSWKRTIAGISVEFVRVEQLLERVGGRFYTNSSSM